MASKSQVTFAVQTYGDLLFDLCQSLLPSSSLAIASFKIILKKILAERRKLSYEKYERSRVLRIACNHLLNHYEKKEMSSAFQEQIIASDQASVNAKLKKFSPFFQRLSPEEQLLLLLLEKHQIPLPEVAMALCLPAGSLKIKRQQALRTLEEWIWNSL